MRSLAKLALCLFVFIAVSAPLHAQTPGWSSSGGNTTTSDKVGIGTTAPDETLTLFSSANARLTLLIRNTASGEPANASVKTISDVAASIYASQSSGRTGTRYGLSMAGWNELSGLTGNGLMLGTTNSAPVLLGTNNAEAMRIDSAGRIGIGTSAPASGLKLHVVGNAQFDGTVSGSYIKAHYQDVAEWVPSSHDLAPGTVVVLDAAVGNAVMASSRAYDTSVAGVVSAQPGIILGEEGAAKEQVATTGRVRVKVDASRGAIAVGDLLVTSDRAGYAMRSTPIDIGAAQIHRPGTIVGKALEPLAGGQGEILVLLSLQ